jgi:hypothetical protein
MTKRTVGSLTHKDFGKYVEVQGYPESVLWGVHHVSVVDGSAKPFTRVLMKGLYDQGTKGLPPETPVIVRSRATL